jgi:hypothetical protein
MSVTAMRATPSSASHVSLAKTTTKTIEVCFVSRAETPTAWLPRVAGGGTTAAASCLLLNNGGSLLRPWS